MPPKLSSVGHISNVPVAIYQQSQLVNGVIISQCGISRVVLSGGFRSIYKMQIREKSLDIKNCTYTEGMKYPQHHSKLPVPLSPLTQTATSSGWQATGLLLFSIFLLRWFYFFLFIEYSLFKGVWEGNKEGQMNEEEAILIFYLGVSIQFIFDSCRIWSVSLTLPQFLNRTTR